MRMLTNKEYVLKGGNVCPHCGLGNVESRGHIQSDERSAWQKVVCLDCKHTWEDLYSLIGYSGLKAPD